MGFVFELLLSDTCNYLPFEPSHNSILGRKSDKEFAKFINCDCENADARYGKPTKNGMVNLGQKITAVDLPINGNRSATKEFVDTRNVNHNTNKDNFESHGSDRLPVPENAVSEN